jgi:hypothetical protein
MPIQDINEYWKKPPKPENGLPENGEYYARAGKGQFKSVHDGTSEFLEVPVVVEEGDYSGTEVTVTFFYLLRSEWQEPALERMKKLMAQTDARILSQAFATSLQWFADLIQGRKVKLEQYTAKSGKTYIEIKEVLEGGNFAPQPQAVRPTATQAYPAPMQQQAPPMVDNGPPWN